MNTTRTPEYRADEIKNLVEKKGALAADMQALIDTARSEVRAMTDEENERFNNIETEIKASDIIASADFRMINIQYYTREDRKGTIHDETEYYYGGTIDHGYIFNSMKQGDMISISGTVYDGDGNVYTGNMIFNF